MQPNHAAVQFEAPRLQRGTRGTGCVLSSAIAASLAQDRSLQESVLLAKRYFFNLLCSIAAAERNEQAALSGMADP
ncbi:bifunctional hydroxymethylpyrimidine kinase/phosphomethylpyrimidine kinase [Mesorhizobium sp. CA8]|uniref:bifunctional hydroxymethylpyrimidine kinase/phosphomethylpyrimidine kinase n=1 Tax=unclassified Mesorhizobium TaxID=325217 RepID=UPI001CC8F3A3|nr:bifunctional hydroxymethylpyrimidine kinase/phosphomethylpyrimidine kinase [Mesorhizobium sp. CA8]MBZ9822750.1 bifunctional hydroxymethylpyrimidine kinase/phosphomethylpyrimidine kinase [Mesorhizobium sp. CA4]